MLRLINNYFFSWKVSFNLPKLDVKFVHRGQGFFVENKVMGIHLRSNKSQLLEESGETTSRFDVQMDFSEIHVPCWFSFRVYVDISNMSVYEITSLIMLFRFVFFCIFFSSCEKVTFLS